MNAEQITGGIFGMVLFILGLILGIYWLLFPMIIAGRLKQIHLSLNAAAGASQLNQRPLIEAINKLTEEVRLVRKAANDNGTCARVNNALTTRTNELLEWVGSVQQGSPAEMPEAMEAVSSGGGPVEV